MNQILEMISQWNGLGQAIFLFCVLAGIFGAFNTTLRYIAICFRGWPPHEDNEEDDDE